MDAVYIKLEKAFAEDAADTDNPLQQLIAGFYSLMMKALYYKWRLPLDIWEAYKKVDKKVLQSLIEKKDRTVKSRFVRNGKGAAKNMDGRMPHIRFGSVGSPLRRHADAA